MAHTIYRLKDGTRVPSVTTVNKHVEAGADGLVQWAYRLGLEGVDMEEARQHSAGVGKVVHALIEAELKGETVDLKDVDPQWKPQIDASMAAWALFQATVGLGECIASECAMVSEAHRFGGTTDWIGHSRGGRMLLDWKTGGRLYVKDIVQVAAYGALWGETHPEEPIELYGLVRLGKTDGSFTYKLQHAMGMDGAWLAFLHCRELYELNRALEKMVK